MTAVVTMLVVNQADWVVPASLMRLGDGDDAMGIPTAVTVIRHGSDTLLIDTGVVDSALARPRVPDDQAFLAGLPQRRHDGDLLVVLDKLGVSTRSVRYVVNTHLHRDHVGGNRLFPGARFLIGSAELSYARHPDLPEMRSEYDMALIAAEELDYAGIDGDLDLFEDNSVVILSTPGHTPGHLSVLVRPTATAPQIVTGDAVWNTALRAEGALPGLLWDTSAYQRSRRRLLDLAATQGAQWVHSHDASLFAGRDHVEAGLS